MNRFAMLIAFYETDGSEEQILNVFFRAACHFPYLLFLSPM